MAQHVEENRLGAVYAGDTGFLLPSDRTRLRAPALSFVSEGSLALASVVRGFLGGVPDLVVERIPHQGLAAAMKARALDWLARGTSTVLLLDAEAKTLTVYHRRAEQETLHGSDLLEVPQLLPGFSLPVDALFE